MFEGQLCWILNKVLGDYIENLDKNQLNVGIWGGDVVLTNLNFKRSALAGLGLPVQCVSGSLGKLVLKIPWKNLYNAPIEASVENLYLLVQPNLEVTYDEEKEQKREEEMKQREIQRYELAKKLAEGTNKTDPGFLEKLLTRIIKNVQIKIANIHIRYEDKVSNAGHPFAMGVTLCSLLLQSTDENWVPCITEDNDISPKIYKIGDIEALAIYWNSGSVLYSNLPPDMLNKHISEEIATKNSVPNNYHYILGPINLTSHLRINCNPELEEPAFNTPFVDINIEMEKLSVGFRKTQYFDLISLHNTVDLMVKGVPFRKYRPDCLTYKGNYKRWWKFAYTCILESEVRRKRRNWNWETIQKHRKMCKQYQSAYKNKLMTKKPTKELEDEICALEKKLDVMNIVITRQKIVLEVEKLGKIKEEEASKKSWFGWWGNKSDSKEKDSQDIFKTFEEVMTPDEKAKLFKAIDYQENKPPAQCPKIYIRETCTFVLRTLEIQLFDDMQLNRSLVNSKLKGVKVQAQRRPADDSLKVSMNIDHMLVEGLKQDDFQPHLVRTDDTHSHSLLTIEFETNPIDKMCGQYVYLKALPLKIAYDAGTINQTIDMFKIPNASALERQLQMAAGQGLNNIKEMSSLGLQYAISQHAHLSLEIELHAPLIIVPFGGKYTGQENVLVVNLGTFSIHTAQRAENPADIREMHAAGISDDQVMHELIKQSYDEFKMGFTGLQVVIAQSDDDWAKAIKASQHSSMHLLNPLNLEIVLYKCLIVDDPRLPLLKIRGNLPCLALNFTDKQVISALSLVQSIPLPSSEPEPLEFKSMTKTASTMSLGRFFENVEKKTANIAQIEKAEKGKELLQFTNLDLQFVLNELSLTLGKHDYNTNTAKDVVTLKVNGLEFQFLQQTYNMTVNLSLLSIGFNIHRKESTVVNVISTPQQMKSLFNILFTMVNRKSPEFHTKHHSCESLLELEFTTLNVVLHQEALQELFQLAANLQSQLEDIRSPSIHTSVSATQNLRRTISSISESISVKKQQRAKKKAHVVVESIIFKLSAQLQQLYIQLTSDAGNVAELNVKGVKGEIIIKKPYTQIIAHLDDISVIDCNRLSLHPQILSVVGDEAVHVQIVLYNLDKEIDINQTDIKVFAKMGKLRIIFLNWFVANILHFVSQFQAAQEAIIEASHQAAENAKHNLQSAYEKATRIALDIDLKAPDVIVPENSKSFNCLLLSMGNLKLTNKFKDLTEFTNEKGHHVVVDEMLMALTDFKLLRVHLDKTYNIESLTNILQPMNVIFSVKRNLCNSWYKSLPDIEISGHITTIDLLMSQMDYSMIMHVLDGNLAEGQKAMQKQAAKAEFKQKQSRVSDDAVTINTEADVAIKKESESKVTTFLKFTFSMDSFIVNLYICNKDESFSMEEQNGLARFSLEGLSIKGSIYSDGTVSTSLLLVNCLLDDTRKGRSQKLNRLIERKQDSELDVTSDESFIHRSMIDVTIQMKKEDIFMDLRVYSFTIILSMDYLKTIADFFTNYVKPPPVGTIDTRAVGNLHQKTAQSIATMDTRSAYSNLEKAKPPMITLNIKIEKPDIVLVEHMDNMDTNALILNSEVLLKVRLSGTHQVISGTVKDIQLYTCVYDPAKRADTRGTVLEPVSISIAGSTPENKGLHLEVHITDVQISISPATLELLNRVHRTAMGVSQESSVWEKSAEVDYSDLWKTKPFTESEYWFLRTELAQDALTAAQTLEYDVIELGSKLKEICLVSMPRIIVTVEAGIGNKTLPMLMLSSGFHGNVKNWSSQMAVEASLTLEMGYYNSTLAFWEPLIEPVAIVHDNITTYTPWEIKFEMAMLERDVDTTASSPTEETSESRVKSPSVIIDITSKSTLELTVTKTCLEVLSNLGKAFVTAMESQEIKTTVVTAPYVVKNHCGTKVTLLLQYTNFKMYGRAEALQEIVLGDGAEAFLEPKVAEQNLVRKAKSQDIFYEYEEKEDILLRVRVNEMACDLDLPVVKADTRYFPLNYRQDNSEVWGIISAIKVEDGVKVITLRSILQVHNYFSMPIEVYYMTARGNELECIATVEPDATFDVPFKAVYSRTNELFFSVNGYSVTTTPFIWKDLQQNIAVNKILHCAPKGDAVSTEPFVIKAVGEMEQIFLETTNKHTMVSTSYHLHLRPAVFLKNCLPINIICCVENVVQEEKMEPGDMISLPNVEPGDSRLVIRIPDYLEKEWSCTNEVYLSPSAFTVWQFNSYESAAKTSLDLGMHIIDDKGSLIMSLYCPFWMINKTGLMLGYRSADESMNVLHHPPSYTEPILFSFNAKNFFGKKKAAIRVGQGEWSDKFSLDVAGSSGVVVCKSNNTIYQVGVQNQLTYNSLTKQITFTPYYVVINNSPFDIECQELDRPADPWLHIGPESCSALWPRSDQEDKLLRIRIRETEEISAPFLFTESHTTLLKLKNKYGGINVDIQMTEGAIYINLAAYQPGLSPAMIVNHTRDTLRLWEKDNVQIRKLEPYNSVMYTWDNPSGSRILAWDIGNNKDMEDDLRKDDLQEFSPKENQTVYWISFLDGMQRVLLFTEDEMLADEVQSAKQFEEQQQEINVSIHGLGFSFVNNSTRQEIMYIGIASSGIIWQQSKSPNKRFKPMNSKDNYNLEAAYQQYLERAYISTEDFGRAIVDAKTEVDFLQNMMLKPHKRYIKRTFQTGLWMQMKSSLHQMQLHAKINRLQIDNQMFDCIFPVVLAPVPPPKSVASDNLQKPFAELSIVQRLIKNSQIKQYKYFKVLVQEFHVKVDLGFINALMEVLQPAQSSDKGDEKELFLTDLKNLREPLYSLVSSQSLQEQKNFYDLLHFSPLKIHVSFSMAASGGSATQVVNTPNFISVLLQSLGVTLTDLQDVVFKLAFFERNYTFLTKRQLINETTSHYVGQSVKQLYVLVLGLDVLGNPYGLVIGITKGVEDLFYEPFQGAIQGPGEFAEGLVLGVRSLFGHTVGGAAGAVSRITGAMGKGIAALTFDKDYQRKRRDQLNKKPASVQEGFARSGKGLVMGVVDGVTGVFTKPISGAKEQGVEGFFKGLGKGAVGLVTRPTAGVIDFASGSLDAVKRVTEVSGEEIVRLRAPRFLRSDCFVRPYNPAEALGNRLLHDLEKGKYANTDIYAFHMVVIEKKEILILTDKRMAYITHNDLFGSWTIDWAYTWGELRAPATVCPKGVSITITEPKKKKLGLFGSTDSGKTILIADPQLRNDLCMKIEELRRNA